MDLSYVMFSSANKRRFWFQTVSGLKQITTLLIKWSLSFDKIQCCHVNVGGCLTVLQASSSWCTL